MSLDARDADGLLASAIEAIYEAAPEPERWPGALSAIANVFDARGTVLLFNRDEGSTASIVSPGLEAAGADYNSGWWREDIRLQRGFERSLLSNVTYFTERHIGPPAVIETHPFYTRFLAKHGIGHFLAGLVSPHPRIFALISLQGKRGAPPFSDDDIALMARIGRHVEKALRLSIRLIEAELANVGIAEALSRLGSAIFVVNDCGHVVFHNDAAGTHLGDGLTLVSGNLGAKHAGEAAALSTAITAACRGSADPLASSPRPVVIRRHQNRRPLVAYVLPINPAKRQLEPSFIAGPRALVLVLSPEAGAPPDPALVRDILDITLGEARVASLIGTGRTPRETADRLGITEETARTVLKRIYTKVGVSRQSELAAMLARVALI